MNEEEEEEQEVEYNHFWLLYYISSFRSCSYENILF